MKKYFLLLFWGLSITLSAQDYCLDVKYIKKEQTNWCGIASTKCVLDYYNFERRQCELAERVRTGCSWDYLGYYDCCVTAAWGCNTPISLNCLQYILENVGNIQTYPANNPYDHNGIQHHLQFQRPIIMRWENIIDPFHGHAMVIYGIDVEYGFQTNYLISYMDPDPIDNYVGGLRELDLEELLCYTNPDTHITFEWKQTFVPRYSPHCYNGAPDADETGVDCGGFHCPPCNPPPPPQSCSDCFKNGDEKEMDCGGDDCKPCDDVPKERIVNNTTQLRKEVAAFNKITAKSNVVVQTGKNVSFITENGGTIILQPGFKAEKGCTFTTQWREDVSDCGRGCGRICGKWCVPSYCKYHEDLYIHDLQYAQKIDYEIYNLNGYNKVCKNVKDISHNGSVQLWNCPFNMGNVTYRILYETYHCDSTKRCGWQDFTVIGYNGGKSPDGAPGDPENPENIFSSTIDDITHQNETAAPNFTIIPNPNPGTFQIETNFPLSEIANLKITNMFGVTVYETQNLSSNTIQLPTTVSGQHFVVLILKNGKVLTQKMMLQR